MYEPLVSIIIPVYNVSKYLQQCLDSVTGQTYKNLEIILVNDGSEDDSGKICDAYATMDSRIIVIHKKNEGLSAARNTAIEKMSGTYVTFVDSDDCIHKQFVEILTEIAVTYNTQLVVGAHKKFSSKQVPQQLSDNILLDNCLYKKYSAKEAAIDMLYGRNLPMYSPGKLYDSSLFQTLHFPNGKIFEDVAVTWKIMKQIENVVFANIPLYFYRQRIGSIINSSFYPKKMEQIYFTKHIVNEVVNDNDLYKAAISKYFFCLADLYAQVDKKHKKEKKLLEKELRKYISIVKSDAGNNKALKLLANAGELHVYLIHIIGKGYKYCNKIKWKYF